jgi:hypothetical protein
LKKTSLEIDIIAFHLAITRVLYPRNVKPTFISVKDVADSVNNILESFEGIDVSRYKIDDNLLSHSIILFSKYVNTINWDTEVDQKCSIKAFGSGDTALPSRTRNRLVKIPQDVEWVATVSRADFINMIRKERDDVLRLCRYAPSGYNCVEELRAERLMGQQFDRTTVNIESPQLKASITTPSVASNRHTPNTAITDLPDEEDELYDQIQGNFTGKKAYRKKPWEECSKTTKYRRLTEIRIGFSQMMEEMNVKEESRGAILQMMVKELEAERRGTVDRVDINNSDYEMFIETDADAENDRELDVAAEAEEVADELLQFHRNDPLHQYYQGSKIVDKLSGCKDRIYQFKDHEKCFIIDVIEECLKAIPREINRYSDNEKLLNVVDYIVSQMKKRKGYDKLNNRTVKSWYLNKDKIRLKPGRKINDEFERAVWANLIMCEYKQQVRFIYLYLFIYFYLKGPYKWNTTTTETCYYS